MVNLKPACSPEDVWHFNWREDKYLGEGLGIKLLLDDALRSSKH
jgi:hypothetical protein